MTHPRLVAAAALCREAAIPALAVAMVAISGSLAVQSPVGARPATGGLTQYLAADAKFADQVKPTVAIAPAPIAAVVATPAPAVTTAPVAAAAAPEIMSLEVALPPQPRPAAPEPIKTAALTDPAETLPADAPLVRDAGGIADVAPPRDVKPADPAEAADECFIIDTCVDRYLWTLYQRAPKEDTVRTDVRKEVTIKRKGKMVTVTRTVGVLTDEDFAWKDSKAADHVSMALADYVIGGMDREFKLRLFYMLHAAEAAGLSPGITSAFRDDYRQSIASGLKAANDRSYHGGSSHGGYGHGLAADIVSVKGATRPDRLASTQIFWKWVDAHGRDFGIGRPYLNRDPPHVGPIDGKEYADHRGKPKPTQAAAAKPTEHRAGKRAKTAAL